MAFAPFSFNAAVSVFGVHLSVCRAFLVALEWLAGRRLQAVNKKKEARRRSWCVCLWGQVTPVVGHVLKGGVMEAVSQTFSIAWLFKDSVAGCRSVVPDHSFWTSRSFKTQVKTAEIRCADLKWEQIIFGFESDISLQPDPPNVCRTND